MAAVATKERWEQTATMADKARRQEPGTASPPPPHATPGAAAVTDVTTPADAAGSTPPARGPRPGPAASAVTAGAPAALSALAVMAAAVASLSGCAGASADSHVDGADGRAPAGVVTAAADALVRAGSSLVSTSMRMASGGTWLTITGTGGFDYADRRGRLRLVLPKDAAGAEEHKPITELLTPGALYMKDRGEGVPEGKWVRVDTTRLPDGNLVTGGATDPLAAAELLRGAQDVTYSGEETVQGVKVRHYRGTTDIARAARAAEPAVRGPLEAAARGFTVTRVPFDAWLDAQGRLRQLTQRFSFSAAGTKQGAGREVTVVSTTRYDGFGAAVPVTMPRAGDIWTGKIVSPQAR
jgi:hypothetical protein